MNDPNTDPGARTFSASKARYEAAKRRMPGGVSSPVRAFRAVGGFPLFIERGQGPHVWDADGHRYVDYVGSWGPMILGHAPDDVAAAVVRQVGRGTSFGAPTELETRLADMICEAVPAIEKVRFVNSGTEAAMSVIRLARAVTGRNKLIKFAGNYHGHADALLVAAGSGVATLGLPDSPGVTAGAVADTLTARYNDLDSVRACMEAHGDDVAAILVEPVAGNMGLVPPRHGFLQGLREIADAHGALLVFDEVMTGFRVARGGAGERFGVRPDVVALGKVIGGGLPVGAYGASAEIMDEVAPMGPMYQAGTLSGNPLAMAAGIAQLERLAAPGFYERVEATTDRLVHGLNDAARAAGVRVSVAAVGSMFGMFFLPEPPMDFDSARRADTEAYGRWFWGMIRRGCYFAPSQFEAGFVSSAHGDAELTHTLAAAADVLDRLADGGDATTAPPG